MSNALVRQSLEYFGYNDNQKQDKKKKRSKKLQGPSFENVHVLKNNKGSKSNLRKLAVNAAKLRLESRADTTEENVSRLLKLSAKRSTKNTAENLLKYAVEKRAVKKQKPAEEPEPSVFTEEDMKNFMDEYERLES